MPLVVHLVGNAHLDPVWLWGWEDGADEAVATFRAAVDRCDEYPEFEFTAGEAWRYAVVERLDAPLFARIRELVAAGRWHLVGGQWVQPDCNQPTGEALRRQLRRGQEWFEDRFGRRCRAGFNPDSFGHPATLPDLLVEAGLDSYSFHRPSPEQQELPGSPFRWRGPGGGEVLAFRIEPAYATRTASLAGGLEICLEAANRDLGHAMCFFGVGDHGGGPSKAQIEWVLEHRDQFLAERDVELRFSTIDCFVDAVAPARDALPLVEGEFQHVFPGCYSAMHEIKQRQRRVEEKLVRAEEIAAATGSGDAGERLAAAWDDVLFTAFHDVIAGTCVRSAWESVRALQGRAEIAAEEATYEALRAAAARELPRPPHTQVAAFNADAEAWEGLLELEPFIDYDDWGARWVSEADGAPVPYQLVDAQADVFMTRVLIPARIEPRAWTTRLIRLDEPQPFALDATAGGDERGLRGGGVEVTLAPSGIAAIAAGGAQLLGPAGLGLHLRVDESDTWTMFSDRFEGAVAERLDGLVWTVEEDGPLRARARGSGRLGSSPLALVVSLDAEGRLSLDVEVTMVASFRALQLAVDLPAEAEERRDGVPAGSVRREPGPAEWPVQGWSCVRAAGRDLALVTADAYSLSLDGTTWQWTLLRTPRMGWPPLESPRRAHAPHTDQGEHRFSFRMLAAPALADAELERAARAQTRPPVAFSRYDGLARPPWGAVPPPKLRGRAEQRLLGDADSPWRPAI
ncbi:MAG TPA: hypothetical protein VFJ77_05160 [Gaiellaceae bacterium]|nr:hypothetical protein [Gaiellaceae bacterium]